MKPIKAWIVSDLTGRNIFYFRLFTKVENSTTICFDSNIVFREKHKNITELIEMLLSKHLSDATKDFVATQLFVAIKKIKYYTKFYFSESILDEKGKLLEELKMSE